jgi:hypothetical protein
MRWTFRKPILAAAGILKERGIPPDCPLEVLGALEPGGIETRLWRIIAGNRDKAEVEQILNWYACQDSDQSGLLSMQESADWQDGLCTRGKGLFLNCLYVLALRAAAKYDEADAVSAKINRILWYQGDGDMLRHFAHTFSTENVQLYDSLGRKRWLPEKKYLTSEQYYLPYLAFRAAGEWFDTLGNLFAILAGVADEMQTAIILDFVAERGARSVTPVIRDGDSDWRDYYAGRNEPHHYQNGGVWPFIGGFHIAALVKAGRVTEAERAFERLTQLNRVGGFNEWHHGETLGPSGVRGDARSAALYLFAAESLTQGEV